MAVVAALVLRGLTELAEAVVFLEEQVLVLILRGQLLLLQA